MIIVNPLCQVISLICFFDKWPLKQLSLHVYPSGGVKSSIRNLLFHEISFDVTGSSC